MDLGYWFARQVINLYRFLFIHKIDVRGLEKLPPGPKVIVANHAYVSDSFALPLVLKEKLSFIIQGTAFDLPVLGRLLYWAGQVPCYAGQGLKMIREAQARLAQGRSIVIYPEGKLNNNEGLYRAGNGAAMLAAKARVPVVPLGFYVARDNILMIKRRVFGDYVSTGGWQWRGALLLRFGDPMLVEPNRENGQRQLNLRLVTTEIMEQVRRLVDEARRDFELQNPVLGDRSPAS